MVANVPKRPIVPSQKRKLDATRDPSMCNTAQPFYLLTKSITGELYKSVKLNGSSNARSSVQPTVTDEVDEDVETAGPEMPLVMEDETENDKEGRFFGGGITSDTAEVLDFIDQQDQEATAVWEVDHDN